MAMSREHRVLAVAFRMPYSTKKTSCGVDALGKEVNTRVSLVKLQQVFYHLHNRGSFIENKNAQKRITSASTELLSVPRSEGLERALSCNSILDGPVEGSGSCTVYSTHSDSTLLTLLGDSTLYTRQW